MYPFPMFKIRNKYAFLSKIDIMIKILTEIINFQIRDPPLAHAVEPQRIFFFLIECVKQYIRKSHEVSVFQCKYKLAKAHKTNRGPI